MAQEQNIFVLWKNFVIHMSIGLKYFQKCGMVGLNFLKDETYAKLMGGEDGSGQLNSENSNRKYCMKCGDFFSDVV